MAEPGLRQSWLRKIMVFLVTLIAACPIALLWYGCAIPLSFTMASFLKEREAREPDDVAWQVTIAAHLAVWALPLLMGALALRRRFGWSVFVAVACAMLLVGADDGGHLLRRAFWGKF